MAKIDEIKKLLENISTIRFAYLFGSYATNKQTKISDIDIAVYLHDDDNNFDTKLQIHHLLEIKLKKPIDLLVLNNAKNYNLLENIFKENILLKESLDDERIMFELRKEHEILDYKVFQRMLDIA